MRQFAKIIWQEGKASPRNPLYSTDLTKIRTVGARKKGELSTTTTTTTHLVKNLA
jgi:hypothetical protein